MEHIRWLDPVGSTLAPLFQGVVERLPALISFFGLILLGWILARLLQALTARLMGSLDRFIHSSAVQSELKQVGIDQSAPQVVGRIVFWIVLFFFIAAAAEVLGLAVLTSLLGGIAYYLPNLLAAVLIGFAGFLASSLARKALTRTATSAGIAYSDLLGRAAQFIILLITVLICIDQIGVDVKFVMILITILVGTTLGGMALAFGLGASTMVSNAIASHYILRNYQVGHTVRIGDIQGRILEVTPAAVVLDTSSGRVLIPASEFSAKHSVLITEGG